MFDLPIVPINARLQKGVKELETVLKKATITQHSELTMPKESWETALAVKLPVKNHLHAKLLVINPIILNT